MRLFEIRSNAAINIKKKAGHYEAVEYLQKLWKNKAKEDFGVSMTELPKLGVNPGSKYNTPVGVYFYPASYYLELKDNKRPLPLDFEDGANYIQIFKFNTDNILEIDTLDVTGYNHYIELLYANINSIARYMGISEDRALGELGSIIYETKNEARISYYGGYLWYVLYAISGYVERKHKRKNTESPQAKRGPVIWNSIFRLLSVDIVIDNGSGIIHENEPTQGVVINPRTIQHIKTVENKMPLTPDKAKALVIDKTAKLINKPSETSISFLFLVTAKFKGKPDEHIKCYAVDSFAAEAMADRFWGNRKDMVDISVAHSKTPPKKNLVVKKGAKPLPTKGDMFLVKINYYDDHGIGQETCVITAEDEADAGDKAAKFLNIPSKIIHSVEVKKK